MTSARMFELHRDIDETGISGTGKICEGIQYSDGRVSLRWVVHSIETRSTTNYDSIDAVIIVHGHDGKTRVVWL